MRQFERLFLESMAEAAPKRYAEMQANATLAATARTLAERAQAQYVHLLAERMRAGPGPKGTLERSQYLLAIGNQVRELVVEELLQPVKEASEAEQAEEEEEEDPLAEPFETM